MVSNIDRIRMDYDDIEAIVKGTGFDPEKFMRSRAEVEGMSGPKPQPHPFCVDCKHHRLGEDLTVPTNYQSWCAGIISLVTGEGFPTLCHIARQDKPEASCGLEGRLFEAKEAE